MTAEAVLALVRLNLVLTPLVAVILAARPWVRRNLGVHAALGLWATVPLAALGALMPLDPATGPVGPAEGLASTARAWLGEGGRTEIALIVWAAGFALSVAVAVLRFARFRAAERRGTAGPAAVGFIAPRLVAPSDFPTRFTPQEWRLVRAHERSHIDSLDGRTATLAALGQWLCWFNPLAYPALAAFRLDQELVCDASVMQRHPTERRRYAELLLHSPTRPMSPVACASGWAEGSLKIRIETLAARRPALSRVDLAFRLLLFAWTAAFAIGWATQAPTRLDPAWAGFLYPF